MNNKLIKKEMNFAGKKLVFETGQLANQANLSIKATYGDTVVLANVVSGGLNPDLDFFPLMVVYEEKLFASGMIKNSRFMKRDGRPTDDAIVARRLVDHAIRPVFPSDFMDEIQVILTVLSLDSEADPQVLSMIAAGAVLYASDIPWNGPSVTARVGYINGDYVLNPTTADLHKAELEMMVSFVGEDMKFLAIEAEVNNQPEEKVLGAIEFARNNLKELLTFIKEFAEEVNPGIKKYAYESQDLEEAIVKDVDGFAHDRIVEMLDLDQKMTKSERVELKKTLMADLYEKFEGVYKKSKMDKAVSELQKKVIQKLVLEEGKRVGGRTAKELRTISSEVGVLPRTHGTGLFNRGETQVLTVATLGNPSLELLIQDMYGERSKRYIHYYNFPPFSTGEVGRYMGAGGREIGHGMLAEKALRPVVPTQEEFPYMILLMSEVLSSNGSTSMASTCGSTLALMDAGVPIKDLVAGISIGLVADEEKDNYVLLTDIEGIEDHSGHMDFKIAGTKDGITAIQLDMKLEGIPMRLLPAIFEQAKDARLKILDVMKATIAEPRKEISDHAPKMLTIKIDPSQIGMVIGSGGKVIQDIQAKTGAELGIEDDGSVFISAPSKEAAQKALDIIDGMTRQVHVGEIYEGTVDEIVDFGAFIEILPGRTGLLHVSEIAYGFVKNVEDHLSVGDTVSVKVMEVGDNGKMSLSKKALEEKPEGYEEPVRERSFDRNKDRGRGGRGDRRGNDRRDRRR